MAMAIVAYAFVKSMQTDNQQPQQRQQLQLPPRIGYLSNANSDSDERQTPSEESDPSTVISNLLANRFATQEAEDNRITRSTSQATVLPQALIEIWTLNLRHEPTTRTRTRTRTS